MHPELFGCWMAINNRLIAQVGDEIVLPSMKHLRRNLFNRARAVGLTPIEEPTYGTNSQHADFFIRNQTVVFGEIRVIAVPIP